MLKKLLKILVGVSFLIILLSSINLISPELVRNFWIGIGLPGGYSRLLLILYLLCLIVLLLNTIITVILAVKYFKLEKTIRSKLPAQRVLPYVCMIAFLFIFSIAGPVFIYIATGTNGGYVPVIPQVCLSAGESVGCKAYYNNGINDSVVQWCEGYYVVATQLNLVGGDGLNTINVEKIAQKARLAGYIIPVSANGISQSGLKYPAGDGNQDLNAGRLCVNSIRGGYSPFDLRFE